MAADLVLAIIVTGGGSLVAFLAGLRLAGTVGSRRPLLFAEAIVLCLTFAWLYSGQLGWARLIPAGGVLYWSNLMPPLLMFAAGLAKTAPGLRAGMRPVTLATLGVLAAGYVFAPVARPWLAPANVSGSAGWKDDICLQSHPSTCAPAAAATLLHLQGHAATEAQMAEACLTSRYGTVPLGLYRGLANEAVRFGRQARVADRDPRRWVGSGQLPAVALIQFEPGAGGPDPLERLLGPESVPLPGEGHAIVVLGMTDGGRWIIGDPAVGRVVWSRDEFRRRFTGDAIYLD